MTDNTRSRLLALKEEYQTRLNELSERIAKSSERDTHWDDQSLEMAIDDTRANLMVETQSQIAKVSAALIALDEGDYGICLECGKEISDGRLEALPHATRCIDHAD